MLPAAAAAFLLLAAAPAAAAGGGYFGAFGGLNVTHESEVDPGTDVTYSVGTTGGSYGGYAFDFGLRLGGEASYRLNKTDRGFPTGGQDRVEAWAVMGMIYYDFNYFSGWKPYVGGGAGFAVVEFEDGLGVTDSDLVAAGQVGAGVAIAINRVAWVTFDYRFLITENVDVDAYGAPVSFTYHNSSILLGVRFQF